DKKMKEPQMLLVKKDVLYCDVLANGTNNVNGCNISEELPLVGFQGPDSGRYVQDCTVDAEVCLINESIFDILVTDNIEFPGSEEGTKLNFNGERYTVTEDINAGVIIQDDDSLCQESGFDSGFVFNFELDGSALDSVFICTIFEDCSGIVEDGELKECIIKNYLVFVD
ncbi:MAG: hypothetical protein ACPKPY_04140, partial [Nitrososphaeraceae archaeon]